MIGVLRNSRAQRVGVQLVVKEQGTPESGRYKPERHSAWVCSDY